MTTLEELDRRVSELERKQDGHATALGKIIMLLEETRLRVSALEQRMDKLEYRLVQVEDRLARVETRLGKVESEVQALRRDLPGIVTAAVREAIGK